MFLIVSKKAFYISHVLLSQKVKGVIMWNVQHIYVQMIIKIWADFQICISVPLRPMVKSNQYKILQSSLVVWQRQLDNDPKGGQN